MADDGYRYGVCMPGTTDGTQESRALATLLREHRQLLEMTQEEVADRAGVSRQTYNKYESGRTTNPKPAELRAVCRVLELDPREIVVALGFVTRPELKMPPRQPPVDRALVEPTSLLADNKLSDDAKDKLREVLKEGVVWWKKLLGFPDLREPSAVDREPKKPTKRR